MATRREVLQEGIIKGYELAKQVIESKIYQAKGMLESPAWQDFIKTLKKYNIAFNEKKGEQGEKIVDIFNKRDEIKFTVASDQLLGFVDNGKTITLSVDQLGDGKITKRPINLLYFKRIG